MELAEHGGVLLHSLSISSLSWERFGVFPNNSYLILW